MDCPGGKEGRGGRQPIVSTALSNKGSVTVDCLQVHGPPHGHGL
uniref:Uncharacterized protein n=1 Tax=Nelumbo nucifera TaxID=4432 RepID=A0A822ZUP9_NELNU|nr:TPA_asm: hypothetical protein HUJ06_003848 [Nelumbo nucifera]